MNRLASAFTNLSSDRSEASSSSLKHSGFAKEADLSAASLSPTEADFDLGRSARSAGSAFDFVFEDSREPYYNPWFGRSVPRYGSPSGSASGSGAVKPSTSWQSDNGELMMGTSRGSGGSQRRGSADVDASKGIPDRQARAMLTVSGMGSTSRRGHKMQPGVDRPLDLKAMARGPDGSGKIAVGGRDCLRILRVTDGFTSTSNTISNQSSSNNDQRRLSASAEPGRLLATGPGGTKVEEVVNLWKGTPSRGAASVTVNRVDWGRGATSNKVIAACSTGGCLVFDAVKGVLDRDIAGDQTRPMLCVSINKMPRQSSMVLTAGADGFAKLWDLRYRDKPALLSVRHPSSITSICFSPPGVSESAANCYVIGLDNGSIFRYDWRMGARSVGRIAAAHGNKAVMALSWKTAGPGDGEGTGGGWLASAGLDKTVKVWDMSAAEMSGQPNCTLHTLHGIRRIAWRPGHETELAVVSVQDGLASGALFGQTGGSSSSPGHLDGETEEESRLEVWDVRRGHIAKYILGNLARFGDKAVVQDVSWADNGALQACYSSGAFVQHDIRLHFRPLDYMPRQASTWTAQGEFAFVVDKCVKGEVPFDDIKPEYMDRLAEFGMKPKSISDPAFTIRQTTAIIDFEEFDEEAWAYAAKQYRYTGGSIQEMCQWNAEVDDIVGREDYMHLWMLLRQLMADIESLAAQRKAVEDAAAARKTPSRLNSTELPTRRPAQVPRRWARNGSMASDDTSAVADGSDASESGLASRHRRRSSSSSSGSDDGHQANGNDISSTWVPTNLDRSMQRPAPVNITSPPASADRSPNLSSSAMATPRASTFLRDSVAAQDPPAFGGSQLDSARRATVAPSSNGHMSAEERSSLGNPNSGRPSPILNPLEGRRMSLAPTLFSLQTDPVIPIKKVDRNQSIVNAIKGESERKQQEIWIDFGKRFLEESIEKLIQGGEGQMSASLLLVASSVLSFKPSRVERIINYYLDLLTRYKLYTCAATVRQAHEGLAALTLSETLFHTRCTHCRKALDLAEVTVTAEIPFCRGCQKAMQTCSFCHLPVKGMQVACLHCGHGGHEQCLSGFLAEARKGAFPDSSQYATPIPSGSRQASPLGRTESPTRLQRQFGDRMRNRSTSSSRMLQIPSPLKHEIPEGIPCPTGCGCTCWAHEGGFSAVVAAL